MPSENPYAATDVHLEMPVHTPLTVLGTVSRAITILTERFVALSLIVLGFWLPAELASSYMTYQMPEDESSSAPLLLDQVFEILIGTFVSAAVIHISYGALNKRHISMGAALLGALKSWPLLIANRILTGILVTLGFVLLIIPGFYLMIRTMLVDVVTVIEKRSGTEAVSCSFELTWQHLGFAFLMSCFYLAGTLMYLAIALGPQLFYPELDTWYFDALTSTFYDLLGAFFQICSVVMWYDMREASNRNQSGPAWASPGTPKP